MSQNTRYESIAENSTDDLPTSEDWTRIKIALIFFSAMALSLVIYFVVYHIFHGKIAKDLGIPISWKDSLLVCIVLTNPCLKTESSSYHCDKVWIQSRSSPRFRYSCHHRTSMRFGLFDARIFSGKESVWNSNFDLAWAGRSVAHA